MVCIHKLNDKQLLFCQEYLKDLNGARAYKIAYPNCKKDSTALSNSSRMLKNAKVKNYIDEKLKELESRKIMGVQEVLEQLTSIARGETSEEVVTNTGERLDKRISEKDRLKSLELLGKYHTLFTEKINSSVTGTVVVINGEDKLED